MLVPNPIQMVQSIETGQQVGCTWGSPWAIPASFVLFMAASLAHEAVHAVGMWPIAEDIRIHVSDKFLGDVHVEAEIDESWRHKWADTMAVMPLVLGLFIALVAVTTGSLQFDSFIDFGIAFAWFIFTFAGGASDFSRQASMAGEFVAGSDGDDAALADGGQSRLPDVLAQPGEHPQLKRMGAWSFITVCIGTGYATGCSGHWAALGAGLVLGGIVLFGRAAARIEQQGLSGGAT